MTDEVIRKIKNITELAPLHNPANLIGIQAFKEMLPDACSVVVFDTAFHQTMPEENFCTAFPMNGTKNSASDVTERTEPVTATLRARLPN